MSRTSASGPYAAAGAHQWRELLLLWVIFSLLSLAIYGPALRGEFLSDDFHIIVTNADIKNLTLERVGVILDPFGAPAGHIANYAPVQLLFHALEWSLFGRDTLPWHVVNVLLHAAGAVLLIPVFRRAGVAHGVAVFGALVFLLHPANAEVVAWISQLKTLLCFVFGTAAVLAHPRRPLLATVFFTLGILSKATAGFALPTAAFFAWREAREPDGAPARLGWIGLWVLIFALYSWPESAAFRHMAEMGTGDPLEPLVQLRTMFAIAARYLVMAVTSWGTSTFQSPAPVTSWLDPWWLAGLALGIPLAATAVASVVHLRVEGGFWIWAAVAYAPISQITQFLFPIADRYLYVVLPALLGVALVTAGRFAEARGGSASDFAPGRTARRVAFLAAAVVLIAFGVRSYERSFVFKSAANVTIDAARNYPDGQSAHMLRARGAGMAGDVDTAVAALRRTAELGFEGFDDVNADPAFAQIRHDPRFRAVLHEMAGRRLEAARVRGYSSQLELWAMARAHAMRREWAEAVATLERAAAIHGSIDANVQSELAEARRQLAATSGNTEDKKR